MQRRRPREIRRRFRTLRVNSELTQIEVSVRAQISLTRYREIENGYGVPLMPDEADALKRVFKVEELFEEALAS